jgi:hypothetical protein
MENVPPWYSCGSSLPSRAFPAKSLTSCEMDVSPFMSASVTIGVIRPCARRRDTAVTNCNCSITIGVIRPCAHHTARRRDTAVTNCNCSITIGVIRPCAHHTHTGEVAASNCKSLPPHQREPLDSRLNQTQPSPFNHLYSRTSPDRLCVEYNCLHKRAP